MAASYSGTVSNSFPLNSLPCNKEVGVRAWTLLAQPVNWEQPVPAELLNKSFADLAQDANDWYLEAHTQVSVTTNVKAQPRADPFIEVTLIGPDLDQVAKQRFQGRKVGLRVYFDEATFRNLAVPRVVLYAKVYLGFTGGGCTEGGASPEMKIIMKIKATSREMQETGPAAPAAAQRTARPAAAAAMGQPPAVAMGQPPAVMGQPMAVMGQPPAVMGRPSAVAMGQPPAVMGRPPAVMGRPSAVAMGQPPAAMGQHFHTPPGGVVVGAVDPALCTAKYGPSPAGYAYTGRILRVPVQNAGATTL